MRGSVFEDSLGRWRGVVDMPKEADGKRRQKVFYGKKKEVQIKVNELIYEIENNLYCDEANATLEQYLKEWFKTYTTSLQETTRQLYKMYMDKHIIPNIGNLKIKKIKPMQLQGLYNFKLETLSGKTVGKFHSFLNRVFKDAVKNRFIKYNPCDGVDKPKGKKCEYALYTEESFLTLLSLVKGTFDEVCILLAGICGLRRGEIFGLRLIDIDFNNKTLSIAETLVRFSGEWIVKAPKSETSQRKIKVPGFVITVLSNYMKSLSVVPERVCGEYKPDAYSKHFKKLLAKHKLEHIRFHDLRHFNATLMLAYGVPDKIASKRLGHSQVQTTREIYQHVLPSMDLQASDIIEGIFTKKLR
ncbi:MAG: site-specific integrase [Candidatus Omnitrophota bacterium]